MYVSMGCRWGCLAFDFVFWLVGKALEVPCKLPAGFGPDCYARQQSLNISDTAQQDMKALLQFFWCYETMMAKASRSRGAIRFRHSTAIV